MVNLFEGHAGPITGISCHTSSAQVKVYLADHVIMYTTQVDLSHLFLTSSFDWTVKLWSSKQQSDVLSAVSGEH